MLRLPAEVTMTSSWKYLCVTLWVIGIGVNTPLNIGIISYEKYGMDPCKRNLSDQARKFYKYVLYFYQHNFYR